ncbi:MAG: hypothetical protein ACFE85_00440 [Candidatus Hodarchaeota archaeon]
MSDDNQTSIRLANKRYGENISNGFSLFGKLWSSLIIPFALFFIISLVLKVFLFTDIIWQLDELGSMVDIIVENFYSDPNSVTELELNLMFQYLVFSFGTLMLQNMIGAIFTVIVITLVSTYVLKKYNGVETKLIQEFKNGINRKILLVILILGILTPLGLILLFIPSIILFGYYIFSIYTIHFTETENSIKEARRLSKGAFMKIIGTFLLVAFLITVVNLFYQFIVDYTFPFDASWYNPATRNYGMIIISEIIYNIMNILLAPLFICILTPLFASLKAKKDLGNLYYISPKLTSPISEGDEPSESGLYCPFCGKYMMKKLRFCPHCGEGLNFET